MWSKKRLAAMGVIYTHLNGTFTLAPIGLTAMKETTRSKQKRKYARSPITIRTNFGIFTSHRIITTATPLTNPTNLHFYIPLIKSP